MNLKQLLTSAAVVALLVSTATFAAGAAPDAGAKFRGDYSGRWQGGRTTARSRTVYRAPAPVVIRSEAAPSVAQTPTERRSFSAEPAQPTTPSAQPAPQVYRSYSYQPSPVYRSYRAPVTRSRGFRVPDAGAKFRGDYGR